MTTGVWFVLETDAMIITVEQCRWHAQCGFVIWSKFDLQLAVAYIIEFLELVIIIGEYSLSGKGRLTGLAGRPLVAITLRPLANSSRSFKFWRYTDSDFC